MKKFCIFLFILTQNLFFSVATTEEIFINVVNKDGTSVEFKVKDIEEINFTKRTVPGGKVAIFLLEDTLSLTVDNITYQFVRIPVGSISVGETGKYNVTKEFYIGRTEVTQEFWNTIGLEHDNSNVGDLHPVDSLDYDEAAEFVELLNQMMDSDKYKITIPTEVQWQLASQGKSDYKYSGSNTLSDVAWSSSNSGKKSQNVATLKPNGYGLYDMSGNMFEWCRDWDGEWTESITDDYINETSSKSHVIRGGCCGGNYLYCQVSQRGAAANKYKAYIGLRLAIEITE